MQPMIEYGIFAVDNPECPNVVGYQNRNYPTTEGFRRLYSDLDSHLKRINKIEIFIAVETSKRKRTDDHPEPSQTIEYHTERAKMTISKLGHNKAPILHEYYEEFRKMKLEVDRLNYHNYAITEYAQSDTGISKKIWKSWFIDMIENRSPDFSLLDVMDGILKEEIGAVEEIPEEVACAIKATAKLYLPQFTNNRIHIDEIRHEMRQSIDMWSEEFELTSTQTRRMFELISGSNARNLALKKQFYSLLKDK